MSAVPKYDIGTIRNALASKAGEFMAAFMAKECPRAEVIKRGKELQKWLKLYLRVMEEFRTGRADVTVEKPSLLVRPDGKPYQ